MPLKQCISCGRWVEIPGRGKNCQACKEERAIKRCKCREERKAAGLCATCGKLPAEKNSELCYHCAYLRRERSGKLVPKRRSRVNTGPTIRDIVKIGLETGEHYGETVARLEGRK